MKIWFLMPIDVPSVVWTTDILERANTPALGGGIGGSESMTIGLAQHFAQSGHEVTIWATHLEGPGKYGRVLWRSIEKTFRPALTHEPSPDVCISVRRPELFSLPEFRHSTCLRVLWAQDVYNPRCAEHFQNAHGIIYVSDWQRQEWARHQPDVAKISSAVTRVAFDPAWVPRQQPSRDERRHTYIYASRPERGLHPLLMMWPKIREAVPQARLLVAGYTQGVDTARADALVATAGDGIEIVRADDKPGLFQQLSRASLLLYPGEHWFEESNGSICTQALACDVVPFVSRRGALEETIQPHLGIFFDGNPRESTYQNKFIRRIGEFNRPSADRGSSYLQNRGREWAARSNYQAVTRHWLEVLHQWRADQTGRMYQEPGFTVSG